MASNFPAIFPRQEIWKELESLCESRDGKKGIDGDEVRTVIAKRLDICALRRITYGECRRRTNRWSSPGESSARGCSWAPESSPPRRRCVTRWRPAARRL